jgi:hypothetical protein
VIALVSALALMVATYFDDFLEERRRAARRRQAALARAAFEESRARLLKLERERYEFDREQK